MFILYQILNTKEYNKVGIASDYKTRLNNYQTSDPLRQYKLEYTLLSPYFREIEKHVQKTFPNRHEWVQATKEEIITEIENFLKEIK